MVCLNVSADSCFCLYLQLLGCAVLGIGIWLQASKGSYASVVPSVDFLSATVLCMSAGILILIIGFFGCCGAIMDNQCMLFTVSELVASQFCRPFPYLGFSN